MIWSERYAANQICNYWNKQCKTRCLWSGGYPDTRLYNFHIRAVPGAPYDLSITTIRWRSGLSVEGVFEAILLSHTEQMLSGVVSPRTK